MKKELKYPPEKFKELLVWDLKNHPAGIFGYLYVRRFSVAIVRLLSPFSISPNMISLSSLVFGVLSVIVLLYKIPLGNLLSAAFIQISLTLGYADGDYARLKNMGSKFGGWLDGVADMTKINIAYFAMAVGGYAKDNNLSIFILLSLLISTRSILAHIGAKTNEFFMATHKNSRVEDYVSAGLQKKLGKILKINPVFLTFSDDVKFFIITLSVLFKQYLSGMLLLIFIHLFLSLFSIYSVWMVGKHETLGKDGWEKH